MCVVSSSGNLKEQSSSTQKPSAILSYRPDQPTKVDTRNFEVSTGISCSFSGGADVVLLVIADAIILAHIYWGRESI